MTVKTVVCVHCTLVKYNCYISQFCAISCGYSDSLWQTCMPSTQLCIIIYTVTLDYPHFRWSCLYCLDTKVIISVSYAVTFHQMRLRVTLCHFVVVAVVCLFVGRSVLSCVVTWCRALCCCDVIRHLSSTMLYTSFPDCPSSISVCIWWEITFLMTYHAQANSRWHRAKSVQHWIFVHWLHAEATNFRADAQWCL